MEQVKQNSPAPMHHQPQLPNEASSAPAAPQTSTNPATVSVNSLSDIDQNELFNIVKILQKYNLKVFY